MPRIDLPGDVALSVTAKTATGSIIPVEIAGSIGEAAVKSTASIDVEKTRITGQLQDQRDRCGEAVARQGHRHGRDRRHVRCREGRARRAADREGDDHRPRHVPDHPARGIHGEPREPRPAGRDQARGHWPREGEPRGRDHAGRQRDPPRPREPRRRDRGCGACDRWQGAGSGVLDVELAASGALTPAPDLTVKGAIGGKQLRMNQLTASSLALAIDARHLPSQPRAARR